MLHNHPVEQQKEERSIREKRGEKGVPAPFVFPQSFISEGAEREREEKEEGDGAGPLSPN